ncbi:hypothetical protein H6503_06285 [Candidatus Woesearchaeota archaeon]|nr:hypothetical protein [Candidatus Woesearchaeota archaeon]
MIDLTRENIKKNLAELKEMHSPVSPPSRSVGSRIGKGKVLVGAPHSQKQFRKGDNSGGINTHDIDDLTFQIVDALHNLLDCHIIFSIGKSRDPNNYNFCSDNTSKDMKILLEDDADVTSKNLLHYKNELLRMIDEDNIKYFVDIHGASDRSLKIKGTQYGVALGYGHDGKHTVPDSELKRWKDTFESYGIDVFLSKKTFGANKPENCTRFVHDKIPNMLAVQIEIGKSYRDPQNVDKVCDMIKAIATRIAEIEGKQIKTDAPVATPAHPPVQTHHTPTPSVPQQPRTAPTHQNVTPQPAPQSTTRTPAPISHNHIDSHNSNVATPEDPSGEFKYVWRLFKEEEKQHVKNNGPDHLDSHNIGHKLTDEKLRMIEKIFVDHESIIPGYKWLGLGACHVTNPEFWKWDFREIPEKKHIIKGRIISKSAADSDPSNANKNGEQLNNTPGIGEDFEINHLLLKRSLGAPLNFTKKKDSSKGHDYFIIETEDDGTDFEVEYKGISHFNSSKIYNRGGNVQPSNAGTPNRITLDRSNKDHINVVIQYEERTIIDPTTNLHAKVDNSLSDQDKLKFRLGSGEGERLTNSLDEIQYVQHSVVMDSNPPGSNRAKIELESTTNKITKVIVQKKKHSVREINGINDLEDSRDISVNGKSVEVTFDPEEMITDNKHFHNSFAVIIHLAEEKPPKTRFSIKGRIIDQDQTKEIVDPRNPKSKKIKFNDSGKTIYESNDAVPFQISPTNFRITNGGSIVSVSSSDISCDADGRFEIKNLPLGDDYVVAVMHSGNVYPHNPNTGTIPNRYCRGGLPPPNPAPDATTKLKSINFNDQSILNNNVHEFVIIDIPNLTPPEIKVFPGNDANPNPPGGTIKKHRMGDSSGANRDFRIENAGGGKSNKIGWKIRLLDPSGNEVSAQRWKFKVFQNKQKKIAGRFAKAKITDRPITGLKATFERPKRPKSGESFYGDYKLEIIVQKDEHAPDADGNIGRELDRNFIIIENPQPAQVNVQVQPQTVRK